MSPTPRVISTFKHAATIHALAYSPDGQRLATASDDRSVQIRAVADGSLVSTLTADVPLQGVSFSPNGTLAAATASRAGPPKVIVFDPATGNPLWNLVPVTSCVFSPDSTRVVLSDESMVRACDARKGAQQWLFHASAGQLLQGAAWSFDGQTVAVGISRTSNVIGGEAGGQVVLLDASSGSVVRSVERQTSVRAVSFAGDHNLLAFGADDVVGIVGLATDAVRVLPNPAVPQHGNLRDVLSIRFSPDNTLIGVVSASHPFGMNLGIEVLNAESLELLQGISSFSSVFDFSPDSRWALSVEPTGFDPNPLNRGRALDVRVWDVATGVEQFTLLQDTADGIGAAVFGPTGATAAVAAGNTATVLQLPVRERFRLLHDGPVRAVAFSPDGSQVLTGSRDSTARVFDAAAGSQLVTFAHDGPVNSAVWIPGQPSVATASADHFARIFDVGTPAVARVRVPHDGAVNVVCVSADGRWLASGGDDGIVHLTEVASGNLLHSFSHAQQVHAVAFGTLPDGRVLLATGDEGFAHLFDTASGATLQDLVNAQGKAVGAVAS
ncbi:WD40 repeat domain-containing protein [Mycobacterium sp.]|uniref:WD40 repeat domain-containing protein n=1 Tax=Mycobacterium sp. TaxID=1785 RepID=UPI003D10845F